MLKQKRLPLKVSPKNRRGIAILTAVALLWIPTVTWAADYPVKWFPGYGLYSYIQGERQAKTVDDIRRQLRSKWEFPITVLSEDGSIKRNVADCGDFFKAEREKLYPQISVDRGAFSYVGLYCTAAQLIVDGKAARESYIEDLKLDGDIAEYLPAAIKYSFNQEVDRNTSSSWLDVEKVKIAKVGDEEVEYSSAAAVHFVRGIAVGDFNNDGVRDILILITHAVKEGTHFTQRLYVMTRFKKNTLLTIVRSYSALEN